MAEARAAPTSVGELRAVKGTTTLPSADAPLPLLSNSNTTVLPLPCREMRAVVDQGTDWQAIAVPTVRRLAGESCFLRPVCRTGSGREPQRHRSCYHWSHRWRCFQAQPRRGVRPRSAAVMAATIRSAMTLWVSLAANRNGHIASGNCGVASQLEGDGLAIAGDGELLAIGQSSSHANDRQLTVVDRGRTTGAHTQVDQECRPLRSA